MLELIGFCEFLLKDVILEGCSNFTDQAVEKFLNKFDILFFVGKKDKSGKEKMLCLESAKLFFGSGPQLVLQLWLLYVTKSSNSLAHLSQYLSVASSFLMASKTAFDLLTYKRHEDEDQDPSLKWKVIKYLIVTRLKAPSQVLHTLIETGNYIFKCSIWCHFPCCLAEGIYCLNV